ncbi:hypothetical protein GcM1_c15081o13 [Golovinomyces cichoracearum]|uniref:Uncharacterized protein n=1 Tax=Golovinomyces cichoracearum TaxID=62708 RepID=A0A420IWH3_9PEZI|nr:hypothetical protein GcM1_c15081o13 [Golovinomyces cichoracearum]
MCNRRSPFFGVLKMLSLFFLNSPSEIWLGWPDYSQTDPSFFYGKCQEIGV